MVFVWADHHRCRFENTFFPGCSLITSRERGSYFISVASHSSLHYGSFQIAVQNECYHQQLLVEKSRFQFWSPLEIMGYYDTITIQEDFVISKNRMWHYLLRLPGVYIDAFHVHDTLVIKSLTGQNPRRPFEAFLSHQVP
uniref:Uncharacterized protein n=1 Tax=Utricularia reniformis TaxID=192314 RepID=A0A1Y0B1B4_9LAMI|nr:hypothetical protein AEK19_MT1023 [Utricularia reniformis]ART31245.1 hypothetical protein AEK19_MT1023 [Utricularia reniformis]